MPNVYKGVRIEFHFSEGIDIQGFQAIIQVSTQVNFIASALLCINRSLLNCETFERRVKLFQTFVVNELKILRRRKF